MPMTQRSQVVFAATAFGSLALVVILALAIIGIRAILHGGKQCEDVLAESRGPDAPDSALPASPETPSRYFRSIPVSKLPGPTRSFSPPSFVLHDGNSQAMEGMDDPQQERWCDISGNYYASTFTAGFSYSKPGSNGPVVRVQVRQEAPTLTGRLEAKGLKPNFAYQIKVRGLYNKDAKGFEAIGRKGRWRLPGKGTNYTDYDYEWYPYKDQIEAYLLFDFFVTDRNGDAVREFALDSTLHVLWNGSRQGGDALADDMLPVIVDCNDPVRYAHPKRRRLIELIWAERETMRYSSADEIIRLSPGDYQAELVLTEESFHSSDNDAGYWATVYKGAISFRVVTEAEAGEASILTSESVGQ